jgi:alpha-1,3-mannosyl-glycoprotein beta-1,2-N-acetylglucosaminyltransferase
VSGFNDNGKPKFVANASHVLRSDFFPGLGWMLSRRLWTELQPTWPAGFWDDWMRQPQVRRGRSCLRPEVSRSKPNCGGEEGVSQGLFCEHIEAIVLFGSSEWRNAAANSKNSYNSKVNSLQGPSPAATVSASRLRAAPDWAANGATLAQALHKDVYDRLLDATLAAAVHSYGPTDLVGGAQGDKKLGYGSVEEFMGLAQMLDIMDDAKDGVPRTAYRGVVSLRPGGGAQQLHLFSTRKTYDW